MGSKHNILVYLSVGKGTKKVTRSEDRLIKMSQAISLSLKELFSLIGLDNHIRQFTAQMGVKDVPIPG